MSRLGSILVQDGVLPVKRMEQAFQRQVIYGGSLDTILLEMGALDEHLLLSYLSRATGLPAATPALVADADPRAAERLPRALAERFTVAPLAVVDGQLEVAVNEPPEGGWVDLLGQQLGLPIVPLVTTEVRLHALLERQYGQPVAPRLAGLLARLSALDQPAGAPIATANDEPTEPVPPPERPSVDVPLDDPPPAEVAGVWHEPGRPRLTVPLGRVAPSPEIPERDGHVTKEQWVVRAGGASSEPPDPPPPVDGADDFAGGELLDEAPPEGADSALALAHERLSSAPDRDAVVDTFAAAGAAFLEYVAVLSVHGTNVVPRARFADGQLDRLAATPPIEAIAGSVLRQTIEGGAPYLGPIDGDAAGAALLERLGRPGSTVGLLLPVVLKGRPVLLLYGDRAGGAVSVARIAPLLPLTTVVADSLLQTIVAAKSGARLAQDAVEAAAATAVPVEVHQAPTRQIALGGAGIPEAIAAQPTLPLTRVVDVETLLEIVEHGEASAARAAADAFTDLGPSALGALMRRFPGRLLVDPRAARGRLPPSQHGPLIALVCRFGFAAVQALVAHLSDANPAARFYSTYLFSEIRAPEAVRHVHWRLYDADPLVRSAAVDALRTYEGTAALRAVLESLRADLVDPDPTRRQVAAEALGELRDGDAVPRLIEVACSKDGAAQRALRSLVLLTRNDFGASRWRWRSWWEKNRARHRVEWLIDALASKEPEQRIAAAVELGQLAGSSMSYRFDGSRKERDEAQRRYSDWWQHEGRARLANLSSHKE